MTSDKKDDVDKDLENFRKSAVDGRWSKVLGMYEKKRELRTAKISETGGTALHMAVSSGREYAVKYMVNLVCGGNIDGQDEKSSTSVEENGDEKKQVLKAKDDEGNIPLHLAASKGNVEMCKIMIGGKDTSLIALVAKRNNGGETPLFLSVVSGKKGAFLCLYHTYAGSHPSSEDFVQCMTRENGDTILHYALEKERIDLAIDIVLLNKNYLRDMLKNNEDGLSPLHHLAATPSIFRSTYFHHRPFIARLLYKLTFIRVKEMKATTRENFEQDERKPCFEVHAETLMDYASECYEDLEECSWAMKFVNVIVMLLCWLALIPVTPLAITEKLFNKIRGVKEVHAWSLRIVEEVLQTAPDEVVSANPYEGAKEAESTIVETPLMLAAKNGIIEMVEQFQQYFPSLMSVVNEEGKNIVLIAAETRQTKLYQFLCGNGKVDKELFKGVDRDGNTALHLAAKPEVHLNWQTTTMIEEFKWFKFVKGSLPSELREKYNNEKRTAEEIFGESYKEYMSSDRQWLNQTSQACTVASTVIATMAFSNIAGENINKKNDSSLLAVSLSLASTISFLGILAFRSESRHFWKLAPFMLQLAILTMFGSIVALWISLMLHGRSIIACAILGSPIAIFTIVSLPIFIGPALNYLLTKVPAPSRNNASAIRYRKPQKNNGRPSAFQVHLRNKRRHTSRQKKISELATKLATESVMKWAVTK